jgi:molecular chaperone GrpE
MSSPDQNIPEPLEEKLNELTILQQSLEDAKAKGDSYYEQLVRLTADFDNFRKRSEQQLAEARRRGSEQVVENILSFADALDQAQRSVTPQTSAQDVLHGLQLLGIEMGRLLKNAGVEPIQTQEAVFDPHLHEVVEQAESDKPEGTILGEIQKGYSINGRVLRHARVRVSAHHSK